MHTTVVTKEPSAAATAAAALAKSVLRPRRVMPSSLSDERLRMTGQRVDVARLAAYSKVCGFDLTGDLPPTFLHVLTMPLQLQVMTARAFPLPTLGLVHTANVMTRFRPVEVGETLTLTAWAQDLAVHPRGATVQICGQVHAGADDLVWSGRSTYLARGVRMSGTNELPAVANPEDRPQPTAEVGARTQIWRLPGDLGRRYAAVSGDSNPIHLNPLAAKAFGFPRAIAHGMWTHARSLAALGPDVPDVYELTAAFKRPLLLPSTVDAHVDPGRAVEVRIPGKDGYAVLTQVNPR